MAKPIDVTDYSFDPEVLKCDIPVLADFWAEWCGPCHLITPSLEEIAHEYEDQVKVVKLDIDENPLATSNYAVLSIPTLILFKFGQPVVRLTGAAPKEAILEQIKPYFDQ